MTQTSLLIISITGFAVSPPPGNAEKRSGVGSAPLTTSKASIEQMGPCLFWFDTRPVSDFGLRRQERRERANEEGGESAAAPGVCDEEREKIKE